MGDMQYVQSINIESVDNGYLVNVLFIDAETNEGETRSLVFLDESSVVEVVRDWMMGQVAAC